MFQFTQHTPKK